MIVNNGGLIARVLVYSIYYLIWINYVGAVMGCEEVKRHRLRDVKTMLSLSVEWVSSWEILGHSNFDQIWKLPLFIQVNTGRSSTVGSKAKKNMVKEGALNKSGRDVF
jgi:hypothetical protein